MNSFYGITLGVLAGSLLLSGCKGVNDWFEREHALMPLKEQYYNGELSWNEYREKKELLLEDMERQGYHQKMKDKREAERMANDTHTVDHMVEEKAEKEDYDAVLAEDEKMLKQKPQPTVVMPDPKLTVAKEDVEKAAPATKSDAAAPAAITTSGEELITDSKDIKWTKDHEGVVTYEDPKGAELVEQIIRDSQARTPPPEVVTVPVGETSEDPATVDVKVVNPPAPDATAQDVQKAVEATTEETTDEAKEDPAKAQEEEPVIMDFGTIE